MIHKMMSGSAAASATGAADRRLGIRHSSPRRRLLTGTALAAGVLAGMTPQARTASAANECGLPVGAALCTPGNYPGGITYTNPPSLTLTVQGPSTVGPAPTGVQITNTALALQNYTINVNSGVTITATGASGATGEGAGIRLRNAPTGFPSGSSTVTSAASITSENGTGIFASSTGGGQVTSSGVVSVTNSGTIQSATLGGRATGS